MKERQVNYNGFKTDKGNIIWGGAMQLAWNQVRSKFNDNKYLEFNTNNAFAKQTINNFNTGQFSLKDINEKDVYVKSGYGTATVNIINKQVKQKFPQKTFPPLDLVLDDQDIISYAYLLKKIKFQVKFERRKQKQFKFKNGLVQSFYATNLKQKQQILVHSYSNQNKFVVEIKSKTSSDSIILVKDDTVQSIEQAIKLSQVKNNGQALTKSDHFQMPIVKLNINRSYKQMIGLPFESQKLKKYKIGEMFEGIILQIDQSGAKVQNEAVMVLTRMRAIITQQPKNIILNRQFWVVMKEEGKHPYVCIKISQPFEQVKK